MRKSKVGSDDFCGIEMRSIKKESTKVFVYFESDSTVEKILKNHSRTIDGRRVNIQQAIVENLKKPTTKKVIRGHSIRGRHNHRDCAIFYGFYDM